MNKYDKILEMFTASGRNIKILPVDKAKAVGIKDKYEIPSSGFLGGLVYNTGGVIAENRIRFYGSGGALDIGSKNETLGDANHFIIGEDIFGGLFSIIKGGKVCYFSPDSLAWEKLDTDYGMLLEWLATGDIDLFYETFMWNGWEKDAAELALTDGFAFFPFLWASCQEGKQRERKICPINEIAMLNFELSKSINH